MATRLLAHRICIAEDRVELVTAGADALRDASFVDGRVDIWSGGPKRERLSDFLAAEEQAAPVARYIFHVAFCGSTLLTRLLTHPGHALVLREPKCLADVSKEKAVGGSAGILAVAQALKRHLARRWTAGEAVVVKPTNYANNILPELLQGSPVKALFLTSSRDRYLPAMFHGGGYRLLLATEAAQRFAASDSGLAPLISAATLHDDDPLSRLARLALTAHEMQMRMFRSAGEQFNFSARTWLDAADLDKDPLNAAERAAAGLELEFPDGVLAGNAAHWAGRHAKVPEAAFSPERREAAIASSFEGASECMAAALDWANREFGPQENLFGA